MRTILILITIIVSIKGISQEYYISKTEAIQDIDSLLQYIEQIHPNPYAFVAKSEMFGKYEIIKKSIKTDSISEYDFFNRLSYLTSSYGDGHLSTLFPGKWDREKHSVLPFNIDIEQNKLYAINVDDKIKIPNESEIVSINDISSRQIIDTLTKITSGEGMHFRIEIIKNKFPQLFYSVFKFDMNFTVRYKKDNRTKTTHIKGINWEADRNQGESNSEYLLYQADISPKQNVCILDFREFSDLDKFRTFTDSTFRELKKQNITNLIIDLRNNSGGNSELGDELFQYISNVPFNQYGRIEMKVSKFLKQLWEYSYLPWGIIDSTELDILKSIRNDTIINPDDYISADKEDNLIELRTNPYRFEGDIYLLTSNYTFSSAADFAWCFKHYNMGKVIGEETGGWGLCYGDNVYAQLPNSKIAINVSCKLFYNIGATKNSNHGVIPDISVKSEEALKKVLEIIKNK